MALDEFQDLRKKYDLEVECRRKAEEYASQVTKQNKTKLSLSLSIVYFLENWIYFGF